MTRLKDRRQGGVRVAVVAQGSPLDPRTWSGTPFHILAELRRRFDDVHVLDTPRIDRLLALAAALFRFRLMPAREPLVVALQAATLRRRLKALRPDVVVAIAAENKVVDLGDEWPVVLISDSYYANMVDYYPKYAKLGRRSRAIGDAQQRRLLESGATILLSSKWAAATAAEHYDQPDSRFIVAPFGANLEAPAKAGTERRPDRLRLLFVGRDWERKGGDLVLDAFRILRRRWPDAELHLVGSLPAGVSDGDGVICNGSLSQQRAADAGRLADLFARTAIYFMPSRQEAYGLVYVEACAFGVPSVAADTGGVGEIVQDGINGLLLPRDASGADFAAAIDALWADAPRYAAMRLEARRAYEDRLNWGVWGTKAEAAIRRAIATPPR